jgi:hypothetical protein
VVLNCWVTETNDTPCASNSSTSLAKSASDRVRLKGAIFTPQGAWTGPPSSRARDWLEKYPRVEKGH